MGFVCYKKMSINAINILPGTPVQKNILMTLLNISNSPQ